VGVKTVRQDEDMPTRFVGVIAGAAAGGGEFTCCGA